MQYPQNETHIQQTIYNVRYDAYLASQSINANQKRTFIDDYDDQPNCISHIEYIDGKPAGSIRACIFNKEDPFWTIPAQELFGEEIKNALGSDCSLVESNKFVIHPNYQGKSIALKFRLLKFVFDHALNIDAKYLITSPRATQLDFYENILFRQISGVKRSLALNFDIALMACDLDAARKLVRSDKRYKLLKRMGLC